MLTTQDYEIMAALFAADIFLFFLPVALIVRRMGLNFWWGLLIFGGPLLIVGLWVLAIRGWPSLRSANSN